MTDQLFSCFLPLNHPFNRECERIYVAWRTPEQLDFPLRALGVHVVVEHVGDVLDDTHLPRQRHPSSKKHVLAVIKK